MMRMRRGSAATYYSLSEFAYIFLFLSIGVLSILYAHHCENLKELAALKEEVNFLTEVLAEKENAVVPCWRRPDAIIPELVGTITIHNGISYSTTHTASGRTETIAASPDEREQILTSRLLKTFREEREYAAEKNCYIRVRIVNETNDFSLYKDLGQVLSRIGMVLVNE